MGRCSSGRALEETEETKEILTAYRKTRKNMDASSKP
jgi:hypothetical protein